MSQKRILMSNAGVTFNTRDNHDSNQFAIFPNANVVVARFGESQPVMRISHDGVLLYTNKASQPLL